jgi:hypothetical protein
MHTNPGSFPHHSCARSSSTTMGKSDYASSSVSSHSDDFEGGPVALEPPKTPTGMFTLLYFISPSPFRLFSFKCTEIPFQTARIIQPEMRGPTPCLIQTQSALMNNERSYISLGQFETNLLQDLAWLTRQLATKKLPKELFDAYQLAGNKCERILFSK